MFELLQIEFQVGMLKAGAHGIINAVQPFPEVLAREYNNNEIERGDDVAADESGVANIEARTEITRAMAT